MFWGACRVVFGLKLEAKSSFERFSAQVWKKSSKLYKMCRPRVFCWVTFGVCWACLATLGPVWGSLLELVVVCFVISDKKCGSADSMPFSSRSAIFAGPGSQVEGTGAQKSYRRAALATFGRLGDGRVRAALSELWELLANGRTSAQTRIMSEGKVYLSDNEYD